MSRVYPSAVVALGLLYFASPTPARAEPLAEKYLVEGKLTEGARLLEARLKQQPDDDQARFGLGVVQALQTFEHLGRNMYRHGLRTDQILQNIAPPFLDLIPTNSDPETLTYPGLRALIQIWIDDLMRAEATLAEIKDPEVKLPLHVALIQVDLTGKGRLVSAGNLFRRFQARLPAEPEKFVVAFDRGDVCWLRGYCHFLAALGELLLAVDGEETFDCSAHVFFGKPKTRYPFLLDNTDPWGRLFRWDWKSIADAVTWVHLMLRLPVKEPARMKEVHAHLEALVARAKEMWTFYLAETDDDNEWIPNPKQKGVLGVPVNQQMVTSWLQTLDECDAVLKGKKLLPFWRKVDEGVGVNLRRVFLEPPKVIDTVMWVQGSAAGPYLEKGELTALARPRTLRDLSNVFGGFNFFGFAFWWN